jgi:hypothetical protein
LLDSDKWLAVMEFLLFISFGDMALEVADFYVRCRFELDKDTFIDRS